MAVTVTVAVRMVMVVMMAMALGSGRRLSGLDSCFSLEFLDAAGVELPRVGACCLQASMLKGFDNGLEVLLGPLW